jgi:hypothetical protein
VTIAGMGNLNCSNCTNYNASYSLAFHEEGSAGPDLEYCEWRYLFPTHLCTGDPPGPSTQDFMALRLTHNTLTGNVEVSVALRIHAWWQIGATEYYDEVVWNDVAAASGGWDCGVTDYNVPKFTHSNNGPAYLCDPALTPTCLITAV